MNEGDDYAEFKNQLMMQEQTAKIETKLEQMSGGLTRTIKNQINDLRDMLTTKMLQEDEARDSQALSGGKLPLGVLCQHEFGPDSVKMETTETS